MILSPVVVQGTLKRKKRRKKEPINNKDLKDEETEDCTEEGFSFVTDYHDSMNAANFEAYFADLCKKLPANSVIVLDNAPYHSRNPEPYPNSKWRKPQLLDWLNEKNIKVPPKALRAEMTLCSVEKLFIKKRSELPGEFWTNCVKHVKKVEESYIESDKIVDIQTEEVLIELGNESPKSDNEVTDGGSECSESGFSIEHEYNKL